ncbi:hypothetical protein HY630_01890 [Candidatus Uhrbacteria bacterium]|nr:hypothetical protein [Candidatus Uhrbacteria bacterium]
MERVFLGAVLVMGAVAARMVFLPEDSVLGTLITIGSVGIFFGGCWRVVDKFDSRHDDTDTY